MYRREALLFFSCLSAPAVFASSPEAKSEEVDVFEGYLNSLPKSFPRNRSLVINPVSLVLSERFQEWKTAEDALSKVPSLNRIVANSLMTVRDDRVAVSLRAGRLNELPKIYLPSVTELAAVLGDGSHAAWAIFYKTYPRAIGLTQFSRVGFNTAFDEAAMFVHTKGGGAGDGDGTGEIAILRKAEGKWYTHAWRGLWLD